MVIIIFFFLLCHVIFNDMTKKKILNTSVIMCFVVGVYFLGFDQKNQISAGFKDSSLAFLLFSGFFLVFYTQGWMGAGDVKLGAALAFCMGLKLFFYVWVLSVGLALVYSVFLKFFAHGAGMQRSGSTAGVAGNRGSVKNVPYGAVLSMAAMAVILGGT